MTGSHGNRQPRSCYQAGCQDPACVAANREYVREWYRTRRRPDSAALRARVPAGPVRRHLQELLAAGDTLQAVARQTGVSQATLSRIARGVFVTVHRRTRSAIAAYHPATLLAFVKPFVELADDADWGDLGALVADLAAVIEDRQAPWRARAACRHPAIPVDTFYVGRGEAPDVAKVICGICPVIDACDAYAATHHEQIGIWAGRAPKERRPSHQIGVA